VLKPFDIDHQLVAVFSEREQVHITDTLLFFLQEIYWLSFSPHNMNVGCHDACSQKYLQQAQNASLLSNTRSRQTQGTGFHKLHDIAKSKPHCEMYAASAEKQPLLHKHRLASMHATSVMQDSLQ